MAKILQEEFRVFRNIRTGRAAGPALFMRRNVEKGRPAMLYCLMLFLKQSEEV